MALKILLVDDHASILAGTKHILSQHYPGAKISTATTYKSAQDIEQIETFDLVVLDLSIPVDDENPSTTGTGLQLVLWFLRTYPSMNIVVQSAYSRSLTRIRSFIEKHQGGFVVSDKSQSFSHFLEKVEWALNGCTYLSQEMRPVSELKPEWLEVLKLAFQEGLQDQAIAEKLNVSTRTVRHYWSKIQDFLNIFPEEGKNIRIQAFLRARDLGLIE